MIMKNKELLLWLLNYTGINALFRFLNRNKAIILWYHGVSSDDFELLTGYDERHKLPYEFNLKKAKKYMQLAGHENGDGLGIINFNVRSNSTVSRQLGEFIKISLAEIGLKIKGIKRHVGRGFCPWKGLIPFNSIGLV